MEIHWRGTQTGPLATPSGEIPPSGRPVDAWSTTWQDWRDGRLVAEQHHLDLRTLLAQVDALAVPA